MLQEKHNTLVARSGDSWRDSCCEMTDLVDL